MGSQARDDGIDVVDSEREVADAQGVRRRVPVAAPDRRGVQLHQLEPSVAVRDLHHRVLKPVSTLDQHDPAVDPPAR